MYLECHCYVHACIIAGDALVNEAVLGCWILDFGFWFLFFALWIWHLGFWFGIWDFG
jgi:hypothetical protein